MSMRKAQDSRSFPGELDYVHLESTQSTYLTGAHETDPATHDWWASAWLHRYLEDEVELGDGWEPDAVGKGFALSTSPLDGGERWKILDMSGLTIDTWRCSDPAEVLDARSADYARFMGLFDPDDPQELHPDLQEVVDGGVGSFRVVIVDRVRLASAWRGLGGVGRLLIGRLLPLVTENSLVVATQPFPIDISRNEAGEVDSPDFEVELAKVRRTWESIGFERYDEKSGLWILRWRRMARRLPSLKLTLGCSESLADDLELELLPPVFNEMQNT